MFLKIWKFFVPLMLMAYEVKALDSDADGIRDEIEIYYEFNHLDARETPIISYKEAWERLLFDDRSSFGMRLIAIGDNNRDGYDDYLLGDSVGLVDGFQYGAARVISGLDGSELYVFRGSKEYEYFGTSLAQLGDLDNDGVVDFAIGATSGGALDRETGLVRVISGGSNTALYTLYGENDGDMFGVSISSISDINGDGIPDLIVGASKDDTVEMDAGSVSVFSGKDGLLLFKLYGEQEGESFGYTISKLSDVNEDNKDEIVVSSAGYNINGSYVGALKVFSGNNDGLIWERFGGDSQSSISGLLENCGDMNSDGIDDLLVGLPSNNYRRGQIKILSGADGEAFFELEADQTEWMGSSISCVPDASGDRFSDIAFGSPRFDQAAYDSGMVSIYSGMSKEKIFSFYGGGFNSKLGLDVTGNIDLNSDGLSDFITLGSGSNNTYVKAFLSIVDTDGDGVNDREDLDDDNDGLSDQDEKSLGTNFKITDTDGDGYSDLLEVRIGSNPLVFENGVDSDGDGLSDFHENILGTEASKNDTDGDGISDLTELLNEFDPIDKNKTPRFSLSDSKLEIFSVGHSGIARSIDIVGDTNGDGFSDVIVGAPNVDFNGQDSGAVYLFSGKDGVLIRTLYGLEEGEMQGNAVSQAGDVDKDGYADFIVGGYFADHTGSSMGAVTVYSGIDGAILYRIYGENNNDNFGSAVSGSGDVNADGYDDFIVAALNYDWERGYVKIFSGKDGSELYSFYGTEQGNGFGASVAILGDINNDGADDFAFSVYKDSNTNESSVYIYSGSDAKLIHKYTGESDLSFGPLMVSKGGDVDGDGVADVLIGNDSSQLKVVSGTSKQIVFSVVQDASFFDWENKFSNAGDINKDGYADILVSAKYSGFSGWNTAPVQVFSGKDASLLYAFNDELDRSGLLTVAGGGDLNGDGLPDIVSAGYINSSNENINVALKFHLSTLDMDLDGRPDFEDADDDNDGISDQDELRLGTHPQEFDTDKDGFNDGVEYRFNRDPLNIDDFPQLFRLGELKNLSWNDTSSAIFYSKGMGDFNGDGFDDLLVVSSSSISVVSVQDEKILFKSEGNLNYGTFADSLGDINGDGISDFLVAPPQSNELSEVSIISGQGERINLLSDFPNGIYGAGSLGDINADGINDYFVSLKHGILQDSGTVQVFSGLDDSILLELVGANGEYFGEKVARAGDLNSDGYDDFMVSTGGFNAGVKVYSGIDGSLMYFFGSTSLSTLNLKAMIGVGDINLDGYEDLAISGFSSSPNNDVFNIVNVISGRTGMTIIKIEGHSATFGGAVTGLDDVDGDGFKDFAISDSENDEAGQDSGVVYVYSGQNGDLLAEYFGDKHSMRLGMVLSNPGDVNGDGRGDISVNSSFSADQDTIRVALSTEEPLGSTIEGGSRKESWFGSLNVYLIFMIFLVVMSPRKVVFGGKV